MSSATVSENEYSLDARLPPSSSNYFDNPLELLRLLLSNGIDIITLCKMQLPIAKGRRMLMTVSKKGFDMKNTTPILLTILVMTGCSGGDADDASPTPTPVPPLGELVVLDNTTLDALEGIKVSQDGSTELSNSEGKVPVYSPSAGPFSLKFEDPSGEYPTHRAYMNGWDGQWSMDQSIIKTTDANAIGDYFGVQLDRSRATLTVSIWWQEENYDINEMYGASIEIFSDYEIALVQNSFQDSGWYEGNTISYDADYATVAFGNVEPGETYVYVETPEEVGTCGAWPSEFEDGWDGTLELEAGEVGVYSILCTRASANRSPSAEQLAQAGGRRPFALLNLGLQVVETHQRVETGSQPQQVTRTAGEPLHLTGQVSSHAGGRSAFRSSFDLHATPSSAPSDVTLRVNDGGDTLLLELDRELETLYVQLGTERLTAALNPDGTYSLNDQLIQGAGRLRSLMARDVRLSRLTEPMLLAWMAGLYELELRATTRFVTSHGLSDASRLVSTSLPGQLGCLRFGANSLSCKLGETLSGSTR